MKKMQEIANGIHPSIRLTIDYPSKNRNNRLPILNTEQWIEEVQVGVELKKQIMHTHYSKPMANKYVIHHDSALPPKNKINILVADLLTVMKNVSALCSLEERQEKIQKYVNRLQYSGYSKKQRARIYSKAKEKYDRAMQKHVDGVEPFYKAKSWNQNERRKSKEHKRKNWYKQSGAEAVFFVPATRDGRLAEACVEEFKKAKMKVKVVEKTGTTIKRSLVKSNPFAEYNCRKSSCQVCKLDCKFSCKTRETVYRITCCGTDIDGQECQGVVYEGETSRSIAERFGEHMATLTSNSDTTRKKSVLYEHVRDRHGNVNPDVKLELVARTQSDPTLRQALEAVMIRENNPLLNTKEEWSNQPKKRKEKRRNEGQQIEV